MSSAAQPSNIRWHEGAVTRDHRRRLLNQKGVAVWMTGLSASGKSTIACLAERMLIERGKLAFRLDGPGQTRPIRAFDANAPEILIVPAIQGGVDAPGAAGA